MDLENAITKVDGVLDKIDPTSKQELLKFLQERIKEEKLTAGGAEQHNKDEMMESIRETLRAELPINAITKTETIVHPTCGENSNMDPKHTVHVDAFLYDDDKFDELCDEGKMSRNYCADCGSRNIEPLNVLTHSASLNQIKYIFQHLLPSLKGKTVLDIGSRTGAVLYGAYLYSECEKINGVEIDSTFCRLQQNIIDEYKFDDRIKVHQKDILDDLSLLSSSDVVILNNVFEFFQTKEMQIRLWKALREALRKTGKTVISVPAIEYSLEDLGINQELDTEDWLKPQDVREVRERANRLMFGEDSDEVQLDNIWMYKT